MKYLPLIHSNPNHDTSGEQLPDGQRAEGLQAYAALNDELAGTGEMIASAALADPAAAQTVLATGGRTITSDGPFAETWPGSTWSGAQTSSGQW